MRKTEQTKGKRIGLRTDARQGAGLGPEARPAESEDSPARVEARQKLSVVFVPYWGAANPYQDALAQQIAALGAEVQKISSLRTMFRRGVFLTCRPDVVHLHWLPLVAWREMRALRCLVFLIRLVMLRMRGIPLIWTVHNLVPHESRHPRLDWLLARTVARLSNGMIVHGQSAKQQAVDTWGLHDASRFAVVPHGNYTDNYPNTVSRAAARKSLAIDDSKLVFLFLGAVRPYKGILELIEAFRQLPADRTMLFIAGQPLNDDFSEKIKAAVAELENVRFHPGFVAEDQVQVYMNAADVAVLPYQHVLSSGAALLVMSFGRPCVAPAVGCLADVLDPSGAFLYDPACETGLLANMRQAVEAKDRLAEMGEHNRQKVSQWTWEKAARATLALYDRCLSRGRPADRIAGSIDEQQQ